MDAKNKDKGAFDYNKDLQNIFNSQRWEATDNCK